MKPLVAVATVVLVIQQVTGEAYQLAKASNSFANRLYEQVSKEPGNVLVCPLSVHIALALTLQGAGGNTQAELVTALGLRGTNGDIQQDYKALLTGLNGDKLKIVNKLYPAQDFVLNSSYLGQAKEYFLSDVELADYSKPTEAAGQINRYVEEHTNNKIHDLISADSINGLTRLVIINAVHFKDTWLKTFSSVHNGNFKVPQKVVPTKFMTIVDDYFFYKEDPALDAQVLKLSYKDGDYSMLIVLPNKHDGLKQLEAKLVQTPLEDLLKDLSETLVDVTIPKFKLEYKSNLKDALSRMHINDIFSINADLTGIAKGESLYVSDVVQKSYINVDENGTEAAAATGIKIVAYSAIVSTPKKFLADHPFAFYLLGNSFVLFNGRLELPARI